MKKSKDSRVFEILVRQHHRQLMGFALGLTRDPDVSKDLVQEALLTAYRKIDDFDPNTNFCAWVRTIIRFKYLEWCAAQKETPTSPEILDAINARHIEWDDSEAREEILGFLKQCIKKLPEQMARVINLFYSDGLSGREIAKSTGAVEATVRKRLERARMWLGDCITKRMHEEVSK